MDYKHVNFCDYLVEKGFKYHGDGSFRIVYCRDKIVVKVPLNNDGIIDNIIEAMAWKKYRNNPTDLGLILAPCRLLPNKALMMSHVELTDKEPTPKWADKLDSHQAGIYKNRWVAYDYALDLTERVYWEKELGLYSTYFHDEWLYSKPYLRKILEEDK